MVRRSHPNLDSWFHSLTRSRIYRLNWVALVWNINGCKYIQTCILQLRYNFINNMIAHQRKEFTQSIIWVCSLNIFKKLIWYRSRSPHRNSALPLNVQSTVAPQWISYWTFHQKCYFWALGVVVTTKKPLLQ
jgi:hypothetical protein